MFGIVSFCLIKFFQVVRVLVCFLVLVDIEVIQIGVWDDLFGVLWVQCFQFCLCWFSKKFIGISVFLRVGVFIFQSFSFINFCLQRVNQFRFKRVRKFQDYFSFEILYDFLVQKADFVLIGLLGQCYIEGKYGFSKMVVVLFGLVQTQVFFEFGQKFIIEIFFLFWGFVVCESGD